MIAKRLSILAIAFIGCGLAVAAPAGAQSLRFEEVAVPVEEEDKRRIIISPKLILKDGTRFDLGFQAILESGQSYGGSGAIFGRLTNNENRPIPYFDGGENADGTPRVAVSHKTDYTSLLQKNGRLFAVSHFEHGPAALYLSELTNTHGAFRPKSTRPLDVSALGGVWYPCAGVVTDWQTHLGAEEFPIDARFFQTAIDSGKTEKFHPLYHIPAFRYFDDFRVTDPKDFPDTATVEKNLNPYDHGYVFEVSVNAEKGKAPRASVKKHYAMGRFSHELAYVMPDNKTVYMSDDEGDGNAGFFMFIADAPRDFSAGTLYAARWTTKERIGLRGAGAADLAWVSLGHSSRDDLKAIGKSLGRKGGRALTFSDIFDATKPESNKCKPGFFATNQGPKGTGECLKLRKSVPEIVASRLETRRYAALKGTTLEFSKSEGLTYDPVGKRLFMAVAQIRKAMTAQEKGWRPETEGADNREHIALPANPCGAVYALDVAPDPRYGSDFVAKNIYELISGREKPYLESSPYRNNRCDVDAIAGPDNLTFLPEYRILIIAEDTSRHENNFVWAYNVESRNLTRIQSMPKGGEATSVYYHRNIGGKGYIVSVLQHPGRTAATGETFAGEKFEKREVPATVGLIGPLPVPAPPE